jgi:uroporphyrinogen decarboxylase
MNSMERVLAAVQGKEADRRAFTMTLSLYGARLTGCPLDEYYTKSENYFKGQLAVAQQCRPDILFSPFVLPFEAQAFGSEIVFLPKSPPNVKKPFIRNTSDLGKLRVPDIRKDAGLLYLQDSAHLLTEHFKETVPICGVLTAPMDLPAIIMGIENWIEILLFDKEKTAAVLSLMSEYFIGMANSMFDNGVSFIAMAMVFSNPKLIFEDRIRDIIIPSLSEMFSKLKGPIVFHHGSSPLVKHLPLYRDLPNIAGFVIDQRDDFIEARANIGEQKLLLGNLEGPTLGHITTNQALEKAQTILDDRKDDRHFIFATSSADVSWDTPMETISGIYDLVQKY